MLQGAFGCPNRRVTCLQHRLSRSSAGSTPAPCVWPTFPLRTTSRPRFAATHGCGRSGACKAAAVSSTQCPAGQPSWCSAASHLQCPASQHGRTGSFARCITCPAARHQLSRRAEQAQRGCSSRSAWWLACAQQFANLLRGGPMGSPDSGPSTWRSPVAPQSPVTLQMLAADTVQIHAVEMYTAPDAHARSALLHCEACGAHGMTNNNLHTCADAVAAAQLAQCYYCSLRTDAYLGACLRRCFRRTRSCFQRLMKAFLRTGIHGVPAASGQRRTAGACGTAARAPVTWQRQGKSLSSLPLSQSGMPSQCLSV